MDLQENLDDNTIVYYVEDLTYEGDEIFQAIRLSIGFYDCHYYADLRRKDVEEDYNNIYLQGDSKLYDSMEENLTNEHWEKLKDIFHRYCEYHNELFA